MKKIIFSLSIVAILMSGCYKDDIDDLKDKYDKLKTEQERQAQLIQTVQNALQNNLTVTSVVPTSKGYKITFSDGSFIELTNGQTPVFTIGANGNWFIDGADTGNKAVGEDGQPGVTPEVKIVDGYWFINGVSIGIKAEGVNGTNGNDAPTITSIVIQGGNMVFTFSEGSPITIPMSGNLSFSIVGITAVQFFDDGETKEFTISQSGVQNIAIAKPDGWKVSISGNKLNVTAPEEANPYAERNGIVSIIVTGSNATVIASMEVRIWKTYVIDFEDIRVLDYLAGPTSYGDNLYDGYANQYFGYDDASTGLLMMINEGINWTTYEPEYNFYNGGIAISQWNDMTSEGYFNQCSVYSNDATTTFGGYKGSKTFAVATGYFDRFFMGDQRSSITFGEDDDTECTFDHFWVTNSTYTALAMKNGYGQAKKFGVGDWFKIVIEAFDKDDDPTGETIEFYLADFRTATSPGIITEWTRVDLTSLGNNVHTVKFDIQSSDTDAYGMNTPGYFCFDNLTIKKW